MSKKTTNVLSQSCYWEIKDLPGLSVAQQQLLLEHGINNTQQLLTLTHNPTAKQTLANKLKVHIKYINKWSALADIARLPSVNCQYCGLLLHAGIASVRQLAMTPIEKLQRQILKLHVATMQRGDLSPAVGKLKQWILEAEILAR
ncbi:MAG: DUF4332 domain-containing protein [Cyanobacteria bacterium J083]|nr:MAG: DUF4332 domain-containing protein [Cyanobacteria bacterium J083]